MAILIWSGPVMGGLLVAGYLADAELMALSFHSDVPDWLEWLEVFTPTLGGCALLGLMFIKSPAFPLAYAILRTAAYAVGIGSYVSAGAFYGANLFTLVQAGFVTVEAMLMSHLFIGARPNLVFRRRVRHAA